MKKYVYMNPPSVNAVRFSFAKFRKDPKSFPMVHLGTSGLVIAGTGPHEVLSVSDGDWIVEYGRVPFQRDDEFTGGRIKVLSDKDFKKRFVPPEKATKEKTTKVHLRVQEMEVPDADTEAE